MSRNRRSKTDETHTPPKASLSELRLMFAYMRPYKLMLAGVLIALIISSASVLLLGHSVRFLVDEGFSSGHTEQLTQAVMWLMVIISALACSTFIRVIFIAGVGERVIADIRRDLYHNLVTLSPGFYESTRIGDIMSRMTADTTILQMVVGSSLSVAARNILMFLGGLTMMILTSPELTMITGITIILTVLPVVMLGKKVRNLSRESQHKIANVAAFLEESLNGVRTLQSYNRQKHDGARFDGWIDDALSVALARVKTRALLGAIVIFFAFGSVVFILWRGGSLVIMEQLTAGQLSSFLFYSIVVAGAFGSLSGVIGDLYRAAGAIVELTGFLQATSAVKEPDPPSALPKDAPLDITFNNVTFHYPTRPNESSLNHISFDVKSNEIVAIVGASGAGKTTILQLLLRFYDIQKGDISLGGINVKKLALHDLRDCFAYVSQDNMIFSTTAYENIRYSKPDASNEEVEAAAKAANAYGFISELPEGFNTYLGEKGVRISGGEKQRIAIARAILKNPTILLLDEATSALDAQNEKDVQQALDKLMQGRTTIVIAHRLSTVKEANRIIVMENGKINEIGTHQSLIKNNEIYKNLSHLQGNL